MGLFDFLGAGAAQVSDPEVAAAFAPKKRGIFGLSDGVANVLGDIGDALLIGNNAKPIHRPRRDAQAIGELLPMLSSEDTKQEGLKRIFAINPEIGLEMYGEMAKADKAATTEELARQRLAISEGRANQAARKTEIELGDLVRKRAAAQLRAGIPRNVVIAAAQKDNFDLNDIPEDPKMLDNWVMGSGLSVKDQLASEDRSSRTNTDREYKKGRLITDTILRGGSLVAGTTSKGANTQVSAGRLVNSTKKGGKVSAAPKSGKIRMNKTTGKVEYLQSDGTYK